MFFIAAHCSNGQSIRWEKRCKPTTIFQSLLSRRQTSRLFNSSLRCRRRFGVSSPSFRSNYTRCPRDHVSGKKRPAKRLFFSYVFVRYIPETWPTLKGSCLQNQILAMHARYMNIHSRVTFWTSCLSHRLPGFSYRKKWTVKFTVLSASVPLPRRNGQSMLRPIKNKNTDSISDAVQTHRTNY